MALTGDQVRWVAHLARLELTDAELQEFTSQLNQVVSYVDQLREVDTAGVEPFAHPLVLTNVFRDDEPGPCLTADQALANAPARKGDFYAVPAVLD